MQNDRFNVNTYKIILTFAVIFNFAQAKAQVNLDALERDIVKQEREYQIQRQAIENLERENSELRRRDGSFLGISTEASRKRGTHQEVQNRITENNRQLDRMKDNSRAMRQNLNTLRDQQKAEQDRIDKEEREARRNERRAEREQRKEQRAIENEQARRQRQLDHLKNRLRRADVETRLNNLDYDLLSSEVKLQEIQSAYDQSLLGAYVQEKMKLLVNSQVLCKSINECSGGRRTGSTDFTNDLNREVFPASGSSSRGGSGSNGNR